MRVLSLCKWKRRTDVQDRPHTAHCLQIALAPGQEAIVVYLRKTLLLSLDDLLPVTRAFLCPVRSTGLGRTAACVATARTICARCSRRRINQRPKPWRPTGQLRACQISAVDGERCAACLPEGAGHRLPGAHEFDQLCRVLGIEHRLASLCHPQTNGMGERFNERIADLLRTHHVGSSEDLEQTLHRYATPNHHYLPQKALNARTPVQALQDWYVSKPELFLRRTHQ